MASHNTLERAVERVLIVDDHAMIRTVIRSMLADYADIQIVGEARNGIEAIMMMEQLHPSIVLMDINMPKMTGIEATARIRSEYPQTMIIGLSVNAAGENQALMMRAGAFRLIPKEQADDLLYEAIQDAVKSR